MMIASVRSCVVDGRADQGVGRRSDGVADPTIDELLARHADALEEREVHVDEAAVLVARGDEIRERVERVLELAARAQYGVEQQNVLDRRRQLPPHLVR